MRTLGLALALAGLAMSQGTGPDIGKPIPSFEARDQNGKTQTFASLRGPKGMVLLFVRSADW